MKRKKVNVGSIVDICDGSWMYTRNETDTCNTHYGKFPETNVPGKMTGLIVIETGCYETNDSDNIIFGEHDRNINTKLVHLKTGEVWYANAATSIIVTQEAPGSTNIILVPVEVPTDGSDYNININVEVIKPEVSIEYFVFHGMKIPIYKVG